MTHKKITFLLVALASPLLLAKTNSFKPADASSNGKQMTNFVYNATFNYEGENGFIFGKTDTESYKFVANSVDESICLYHNEDLFKTSVENLPESSEYTLSLVVNENIAKLYVNRDKTASIVCALDSYNGGEVTVFGDVTNKEYFQTDTVEGDIFVGGYDVSKVINITDGNYRLETSEYTLDKGIITIDSTYLKTLESDQEYVFRAVTSLTDLSFVIKNDFSGVKASLTLDKIYRGNDAVVELNKMATTNKVTIDDEEVNFVQDGLRVTISSETLDNLSSGDHIVKLYTDNGRPEVKMYLTDATVTYPEIEVEPSHFFFFVDISIFAGLILAYVGYSAYKKSKEDRR